MNAQEDYAKEYFQGIYARLAREKKEVLASFFHLLSQRLAKIETILDLGCGEGEFLQLCEQSGILSFGVDISEYALKKAKHKSRAKFIRLDLNKEKLPFQDKFFDAVTCFDLLEHLSSSQLLLSEAYRVLKPGGVLFVTTPNAEMWFSRLLGLIFPVDKTHINVQGPRYWQQKLVEAGFDKITVRGCFLFGFPPGLDLRFLCRKLKLTVLFRPLFIPFLPLTSTLFIFASPPRGWSR